MPIPLTPVTEQLHIPNFSDAIMWSRTLTCSIVVRLYYCRDTTCCYIGAIYGFSLSTYDGTDKGSAEESTEGTTYFLQDYDLACQVLQ